MLECSNVKMIHLLTAFYKVLRYGRTEYKQKFPALFHKKRLLAVKFWEATRTTTCP